MASLNIAGVVGVGKSSLCGIYADKGYEVYYEPVFDNDLLEKFYADKEKYAFPLQIYFLNKRFQMYKDSLLHRNTVMDRSIVEDRIFAKMLKDRGELNVKEYDIYMDLFTNMMQHVCKPDLMVYLRIKTDNVLSRIQKRGREYELSQSKEYWASLNSNYEIFFNEYTWSKLLVIDVDNIDFVGNQSDKEWIVNLIDSNL